MIGVIKRKLNSASTRRIRFSKIVSSDSVIGTRILTEQLFEFKIEFSLILGAQAQLFSEYCGYIYHGDHSLYSKK